MQQIAGYKRIHMVSMVAVVESIGCNYRGDHTLRGTMGPACTGGQDGAESRAEEQMQEYITAPVLLHRLHRPSGMKWF